MTTTLRVHGLDYADEAAQLREALQSRPSVRELSFDLLRGLMVGVSLAVVFNALRRLRS